MGPAAPPASEALAPQFPSPRGSLCSHPRPQHTRHVLHDTSACFLLSHQGFGTGHHRRRVSESPRPTHVVSGETWPCRGMCMCVCVCVDMDTRASRASVANYGITVFLEGVR